MTDVWSEWLMRLPELRVALLTLGCFGCTCAALYFLFQIVGKGKELMFMMCRTVLEAALVSVTAFLALLCLGMLMKDFSDHGVQGLFPTAIQAYYDYVALPLVYSWTQPLHHLQEMAYDWLYSWAR